jgi:hypothetical protein
MFNKFDLNQKNQSQMSFEQITAKLNVIFVIIKGWQELGYYKVPRRSA